MTQPELGVVILAAGAGTRLGGVAKATLVHERATYLEHILAKCDAVGVGTRIVVVGPPHAAEVRVDLERIARARSRASLESIPSVSRPNLYVVDNPNPERGMASSISLGFAELSRAVPRTVTAAFLWPVDHPFVREATLRELIKAFVDSGHAATADPDIALADTPDPEASDGELRSVTSVEHDLVTSVADTEVVRPRYGEHGGHPPLVARAVWSALATCATDPLGARGVLAKRRTRDVLVEDSGVVFDVDTPADLDPHS
ncbi:MAG TPA: NTP transferase domain-containing protein [Kofleriaceae bacterium]|jgi:CTP:molybdopterin cytidylyltransferase MocA